MRYECCYTVRAKGSFKSHFKLNRDLMKYQLTVYTRATYTFAEREFVKRDILECAIFWLSTARLLDLKNRLY